MAELLARGHAEELAAVIRAAGGDGGLGGGRGGDGGGGGGGGGLYVLRGPQSVQSVPSLHLAAEEPGPPSSQMPFNA